MRRDRSSADFYSFVQLANLNLSGQKLDPTQTYIQYICHELFNFIEGRTTNLLINLPGRHLKTITCSVCMPAFMLGLDPSLKILIVAYDEEIATDIVRSIRKLMRSKAYKTLFRTRIDVTHDRKNDFDIVGGGRVRAVPIRSVTGKGGDIVVFDDPHNVSDWNNTRRKHEVVQFFNTLMTRRNAGRRSQMLVVGHRVASDDLSAHIEESEDFHIVRLPLFAPRDLEFPMGAGRKWHFLRGHFLRPDAFSEAEVKKLRLGSLGGSSFWLHYQQGLGVNDLDINITERHFPVLQGRPFGSVVLSVDPTAKTASSSRNVVHAYAMCGDKYVLIDAFAEKCTFDRLLRTVERFSGRYQAALIIIEETGRGGDLIEALHQNHRVRARVEGVIPRGTKLSRFMRFVHLIQRKKVQMVGDSEDVDSAISEIINFPNSQLNDHVDALTNFLVRMDRIKEEPLPAATRQDRVAIGLALGSARTVASADPFPGIGIAFRSRRF
jgi:predicted phage terminase large subunit-like protein